MTDLGLTRHNPHLSRLTRPAAEVDSVSFAADCNSYASELPDGVANLIRHSLAQNTRKAYASDLEHFLAWGGTLPSSDRMVASYLAAHADELTPATLTRRLAAISKAHRAHGLPSPTSRELVTSTMRGIRRRHGAAQRRATPLLRDDLFQVLAAMGDGMKDVRDRALLLLGFATALRRSELMALDCADLQRVRQGLVINVRRSKTDQDGEGRKIGVPVARGHWCPVVTVEEWLRRSGIANGAVFRAVNRHGHVLPERLSGEAVSMVVAERAGRAGLQGDYTGHSLRAGLATSAAQAGVPAWRIRQTTGHASDAMLARYIRDGELFTGIAAGALL